MTYTCNVISEWVSLLLVPSQLLHCLFAVIHLFLIVCLGPERNDVTGAWREHKMRSAIVCAHDQILLG